MRKGTFKLVAKLLKDEKGIITLSIEEKQVNYRKHPNFHYYDSSWKRVNQLSPGVLGSISVLKEEKDYVILGFKEI